MKPVADEIKRLTKATRFSMQGIVYAFKNEAAFRTDVIIALVLLPIALLLEVTTVERVLLVGSVLLLLIVELLNTAVEAAIDRISRGHHPLSGIAKDMGSAAVLFSLIFGAFTWGTILFDLWF